MFVVASVDAKLYLNNDRQHWTAVQVQRDDHVRPVLGGSDVGELTRRQPCTLERRHGDTEWAAQQVSGECRPVRALRTDEEVRGASVAEHLTGVLLADSAFLIDWLPGSPRFAAVLPTCECEQMLDGVRPRALWRDGS